MKIFKTLLFSLTGIILTGCSSFDRHFETPWNKEKQTIVLVPESAYLNDCFELVPQINIKRIEVKKVDEKTKPDVIEPEKKKKERGYIEGETAIVGL